MLRQTFPTSVSHVDLAGAGQEIVRPAPAPASGPRSRSPRVLEDPERFERHVTYVVVCVLYALGLSFMDIYFSQARARALRAARARLSAARARRAAPRRALTRALARGRPRARARARRSRRSARASRSRA